MTNSPQLRFAVTLIVSVGLAAPLAAENSTYIAAVPTQSPPSSAASDPVLARFAPKAERRDHRIDYTYLDEALSWMVIPMGPSIRQGSPRVDPELGSRRIYGHESRFRLEGNRVAFSFLTDDIRASLAEYRADLERVGTQLDIASLPRNEQLAFWLNLHNVAMVEALASRYPLAQPSEERFGSNDAPIDDAKLVTIDGIALSPRDIREKIVYPNWRDPKVLYGFWRGVIGGPSIQRLAYNGSNVDTLLDLSAEEFVNSLRGVERWGGALRVSPIYQEAESFYFSNSADLRSHLAKYAREDTARVLAKDGEIAYKSFETDIADLIRGESNPSYAFLARVENPWSFGGGLNFGFNDFSEVRTRPDRSIQRLMEERAEKLRRAEARGIRTGMVIYGNGEYSEGEAPPEVE